MSEQEWQTVDEDEMNYQQNSGRSNFLTVLLVLSAISVAWAIISGVVNGFQSEEERIAIIDDQIEQIADMDDYPYKKESIEFLTVNRDKAKITSVMNLLLMLIQGLAVYWMYQLKRNGFWLYVVVQVTFLVMYWSIWPSGNILTWAALAAYLFLSALFVVLYAVNLKQLKN